MKPTLFMPALLLACSILTAGCSQRSSTTTSEEAVAKVETIESTDKKIDFLLKEARTFLDNQKYEEAMTTARYILNKLNSRSVEARAILEHAEAEVKKMASQKIDDVMKNLQNTSGSLGR